MVLIATKDDFLFISFSNHTLPINAFECSKPLCGWDFNVCNVDADENDDKSIFVTSIC